MQNLILLYCKNVEWLVDVNNQENNIFPVDFTNSCSVKVIVIKDSLTISD